MVSDKATSIKSFWGSETSKRAMSEDKLYQWFLTNKQKMKKLNQLSKMSNPTGAGTEVIAEIEEFTLHKCNQTGFIANKNDNERNIGLFFAKRYWQLFSDGRGVSFRT